MIAFAKATTGLVVAAAIFSNSMFFEQFNTAADIPSDYFAQKKTIYGRVERVIDGDTIRVQHCPNRFSCPELDENSKRIYDRTISIRFYGVDCPELQKRKSDPPSQPYAVEAKQFTSDSILGKKVKIKLLRKDQYGRAIAKVEGGMRFLPPFSRPDMSVELVRRGLATLYTAGGAEYDGNKESLLDLQSRAQNRKFGVWSQGKDMITPGEFKRQQKQLMQAAN